MPIRLVLRVLVGSVAMYGVLHAETAAGLWLSLIVAAPLLLPLLAAVEVPDEDRSLLVQAFRDALRDNDVSLKAASILMELHSAADLLHALARERQCDLFWRLLKLPLDVQRSFHLYRLVALGLPDKTVRMLKIAAVVEPLAMKRSA